ncbi:DUF4189 domain-containing protein [Nocardia crassostreae]|uniref:DUF4189 domain-containing protein n=1 Tax=Nocardia crassostreae TaxID=53428 RepID=UPI00082C4947|nr:DUF4189 domain-containing protein [Nocardia crassostreae]
MFALRKAVLGLAVVSTVAVTGGAGTAAAEPGPDGRYYGSLALATGTPEGTVWGVTWNYPSHGESDRDAIEECGYSNCTVIARFVDECVALAKRDGRYLAAVGPTRADAERAAIAAFGPPRPATMSAAASEATLLDSQCSGDAS